VNETIDIRGSAAWSPDGKWIAAGGNDGSGPGLFKVPKEGGAPVRLTSGEARNPVWSPDNNLVVYSGTNSSGGEPVLAVRPDGNTVDFPALRLRLAAGGERMRFLPDGKGLVFMEAGGSFNGQNFYLLDLATMKTRPLTKLDDSLTMRTFDIAPDARTIVFDRMRENSDIELIELPAK
jgi:Tol biopolymer transport system component